MLTDQYKLAPQLSDSRRCAISKASKAEAVVYYCETLATQVEDPAQRGDGVAAAFPAGKQNGDYFSKFISLLLKVYKFCSYILYHIVIISFYYLSPFCLRSIGVAASTKANISARLPQVRCRLSRAAFLICATLKIKIIRIWTHALSLVQCVQRVHVLL